MKKINNFIDNTPYWLVFLISTLVFGLITFGMFNFEPIIIRLKTGLVLCLFSGGFICLSIRMMRISKKFWELSREIENKINLATTKLELDNIEDNDFKRLRHLGSGELHNSEQIRLMAILVTKYKYVK